jgi:hypothetical protein
VTYGGQPPGLRAALHRNGTLLLPSAPPATIQLNP